MLPNTITLDLTTIGQAADTAFSRHGEQANRSDYIGAGHTTSSRNMLQIYRTFPKRNGASLGVRKAALKITKDQSVPTADGGTMVAPLIAEVSVAIPEGTPDTQVLLVCDEIAACMTDPFNDADFVARTLKTLEI